MTPYDRLHPALRHHVVNSLGWKDLRSFQQAVIGPAPRVAPYETHARRHRLYW